MASKVLTSLPQDAKEFQQRIKRSKVIGIIGYGNQGRSQALNLKDNGFKVIVGNVRDSYYSVAENDGFESYDIATAAETGDILFILIPDEVQPKVFGKEIDPNLGEGKTVVFASGYNYYYGFVVPKKADVLMIAPRMIGWGIRDLFLRKMGFPVLIANDHAGDARKMVLALTDGIGAFQSGGCAIESSFREETLLDLLTEHTWAGAMLFLFRTYFEVATDMGASPEAAILEMYASGELEQIARSMKEIGLFKQLRTHSHTSQYGQLTRGPKFANGAVKQMMRKEALDILNGAFAREWTTEEDTGMVTYRMMHKLNSEHPMEKAEEALYEMLGRGRIHD